MKKNLLIINPVSGGLNKKELINEMKSRAESANHDLQLIETTGKNDSGRVQSAIDSFAPNQITLAGGDGTIHELTEVMSQAKVPVGIIPAGSANGLARELGINRENAIHLCYESTNSIQMDLIRIGDQIMIHLADLGLNANMIKRYEDENRRGIFGYAISGLKELINIEKPFEATIKGHDFEKTVHSQLLVIANARMYGNGYVINPSGKLNDGCFEICVLKDLSPSLILNSLFSDLTDQDNLPLFDCFAFEEVTVSLQNPTHFQIDGEYQGTPIELDISMYKRKLEVLCP